MNPLPISFPKDHSAHDAIIEWWYFNGHLTDKEGNRYSFMDCLFKADIGKVNIPYLKHASLERFFGKERHTYFANGVLSDISKQKNYKEVQNVSMISADSFKQERLFVNYIDPIILRGYVNNEIAEAGSDIFHIKNKNVDLILQSKKPALLEGGNGHIEVCGRGSYYYSLTHLKTTGTLLINGKKIEVEGTSWMDHQWADVSYAQDKWTWFSIQLDGGTDLMCCEYDNGTTRDYVVDIIDKKHTQFHFKKSTFTPGKDLWKSESTKAEYPMSWHIEIPEYEASFDLTSLMSDQEIIFMAINYWEGPIEVSGTIKGKKVAGVGFMELVGYPSDYNHLVSLGKEIAKKISGSLENTL